MFKNIQIKIIIIMIVISAIMLGALGYLFVNELENLKSFGVEAELLDVQISRVKKITILIAIALGVISTIVIAFSIKVIVVPINKLIKASKNIAEGKEAEENKLKETKTKTEIDELTKSFKTMILSLKDNLNEVNRQKNQIETILLHMTDGIIAFNSKRKNYTY